VRAKLKLALAAILLALALSASASAAEPTHECKTPGDGYLAVRGHLTCGGALAILNKLARVPWSAWHCPHGKRSCSLRERTAMVNGWRCDGGETRCSRAHETFWLTETDQIAVETCAAAHPLMPDGLRATDGEPVRPNDEGPVFRHAERGLEVECRWTVEDGTLEEGEEGYVPAP
jgi:hypothetical protein